MPLALRWTEEEAGASCTRVSHAQTTQVHGHEFRHHSRTADCDFSLSSPENHNWNSISDDREEEESFTRSKSSAAQRPIPRCHTFPKRTPVISLY